MSRPMNRRTNLPILLFTLSALGQPLATLLVEDIIPAASAQFQSQSDIPGIDLWHAPLVQNDPAVPEINVRVANFAVEHLGKQIGNGECWTLAKEALASAGAQPPRDYVFGRELGRGEPWLPGDIIQFSSCHFVDVQPHRRTTFDLGSPNHTAIIHSLQNGKVVILQQNVNGDRHVQTQTLNFANMVGGSFKLFRPVPASMVQSGAGQNNPNQRHHKHDRENAGSTPQQGNGAPAMPGGPEVSTGPMYGERQALLQQIRQMQANGVNVFFYMQRFLDIDSKAHAAASKGGEQSPSAELTESMDTLKQLLSVRESRAGQQPLPPSAMPNSNGGPGYPQGGPGYRQGGPSYPTSGPGYTQTGQGYPPGPAYPGGQSYPPNGSAPNGSAYPQSVPSYPPNGPTNTP